MQEEENRPRRPRVLPEPSKDSPVDPIIAADTLHRQGRDAIPSDTLGSYTGTPEDGIRPVQDADDL